METSHVVSVTDGASQGLIVNDYHAQPFPRTSRAVVGFDLDQTITSRIPRYLKRVLFSWIMLFRILLWAGERHAYL